VQTIRCATLGGMRKVLADLQTHPAEVIVPSAIFLATFLLGLLVRKIVLGASARWSERTDSRAGRVLHRALAGPMVIWALILAAHLAFEGSELPAGYTARLASVLLGLWIVSLTMMCRRIVGNLVRHYGNLVPGAMPVTTLTQNLAQIAVVILGGLILLNHFDVSITPMLTALGVGGLAVALALQDTLSNLFGGFYVAVAGQVRLGDYIKLNSGEEGYVSDIGWRSTTMRALANNLIIVPNAKLAQAIVTNYHLPEKRMSASFSVTVGYECDPDEVEQVLNAVLAGALGQVKGLLAEPAPAVTFDPGFGDSGMVFQLSVQVGEFADQFPVRNELRRRVLRALRGAEMGIPYPSRTVYLRGRGSERVREGEGTQEN
jgi:small-conductance mechanosensitive channel